jgi:tetratricopeptide (TPR) repeat protein
MLIMRPFNFFLFLFFLLIGCRSNKEILIDNSKIDVSMKETQYYKLFTDATKHALFGNFQSAVPLYKACIQLYPDRAAPYYQLSSIFIRNQDGSNAMSYAEKSYFLDTANIWYAVNLANIYQYLGFLDSAASIYLKVLDKKDDEEISYNLALIYSQLGKSDKAEKLLKKIDKKFPGSREIILMRHNIFNEKRSYDSAIYELELLTKYFPEDINNFGLLAEYLSEIGRREFARKTYITMLKMDSTNGLSLISFAEYYLKENFVDSAFFYFTKAFKFSDLTYSQKIDLLVNHLNNKDLLNKYSDQLLALLNLISKEDRDISFYSLSSDIYIGIEQYNLAKPFLDSALMLEKKNYQLWEQTLLINSFLNNDSDILVIADECLKYFKDKPTVYLFKAYAEKDLNELDSAINDAEKVSSLKTDNKMLIQSYILLAESYREKGEFNISDEYFEKILDIEPANLPIRNNYAYYLSIRGKNLQRAKELSKFTIESEPKNATYLDTYGWVLFKMGKINEAKEVIENSIRNGAFDNAEVIEHYGDIMNALGRCKDSIEAYERVNELDSSLRVKNKLELLKSKCE